MSPTGSPSQPPPADDLAPTGQALADGGAGQRRQPPAAAVAAALADRLAGRRRKPLVYLASSERRAEEIRRALAGMAPGADPMVLPPWDCLPFDRASPSRDVMGRRMQVLRRLAEGGGPLVLILAPEALVQRLPPTALAEVRLTLNVGDRLDRLELQQFAARTGYVEDDRIDEPGEIALFGEVVDVFPADAAQPVRIVLADEVIDEMRLYDPLSQRSDGAIDSLVLLPASEAILDDGAAVAREPGVEHRLSVLYEDLPSVFDLIPSATLLQDEKAPERLSRVHEQIAEALESRRMLSTDAEAPSGLYLEPPKTAVGIKGWTPAVLDLDGVEPVQSLAAARNPGRAFCDLVAARQAEGWRVVLTGLAHELRPLGRALERGLGLKPDAVADWPELMTAPAGGVSNLELDLDAGFLDPGRKLAVIAAADVLGGRLAGRKAQGRDALAADQDLRLGDIVLHEDHGVGVLRDLETLDLDGQARDALRLEYHGGASVLAPIEEIGRIWRYGAEAAAVTLDRLTGDGWAKRRAEVSRHIDAAAAQLISLAQARDARTCPPLEPPKAAYARFAARFAYPETVDQTAAIEAVLADLASGRPMDRLVCGDVGFGKTEVALRAAAAVALSGRQVSVVAPTTVLARQHFETFRRRFAGTGVGVVQLSRLVGAADMKAARAGIAAGEVGVVIGTHAVAAEAVAFADLGLMIIDEEQKFGAAMKARLRDLAGEGHLLTLTATPIPRTLQAAMVGLQDVSIIASPPARRRPVRTFLAPFDPATVRTALLRERRRSGQSFLVVPRIEDIAPLAARLADLTPELSVRVAHGGLAPEAADEVMVGFAGGDGDVLLATNIIESGLDVPRANTMLIWRPDRFGLSQLHQLRGRVGRGRAQGVAYLLSDPADDLSEATRARLSTLEAFDRLGAGLAISSRDLDLRGGGDFVGEDQAGHRAMIGAALYQRLLDRAIRTARGEAVDDAGPPVLQLGASGAIPVDHVPDAVTRVNLYARLARLEQVADIDAFEEELEDRFGPLPPAAQTLLGLSRLQALARAAGVRHVGAGPKAIALTVNPKDSKAALKRLKTLNPAADLRGERIVVPAPPEPAATQFAEVERLLAALA